MKTRPAEPPPVKVSQENTSQRTERILAKLREVDKYRKYECAYLMDEYLYGHPDDY